MSRKNLNPAYRPLTHIHTRAHTHIHTHTQTQLQVKNIASTSYVICHMQSSGPEFSCTTCDHINRVGQKRIGLYKCLTPYMIVYLMKSPPKYVIHLHIHMVLASPTYSHCTVLNRLNNNVCCWRRYLCLRCQSGHVGSNSAVTKILTSWSHTVCGEACGRYV